MSHHRQPHRAHLRCGVPTQNPNALSFLNPGPFLGAPATGSASHCGYANLEETIPANSRGARWFL